MIVAALVCLSAAVPAGRAAASDVDPSSGIAGCHSNLQYPQTGGNDRVHFIDVADAFNSPKTAQEQPYQEVIVVTPDNYASNHRYPVLYMLHGSGGVLPDEWLSCMDTLQVDALKNVILVMPTDRLVGEDRTHDHWYTDTPDPADNPGGEDPTVGGTLPPTAAWKGESFIIKTLLPYIDHHYSTFGDRAHRAIAGLSGGGFGSMHLAARHPDLFVAALAFSGGVYESSGTPDGVLPWADGTLAQGGDVFGDPLTQEVQRRTQEPTDLAVNLHHVALFNTNGNNVPCPDDPGGDVATLQWAGDPSLNNTNMFGVESTVVYENVQLQLALRTADPAPDQSDYHPRSCGLHDYPLFSHEMHDGIDTVLAGAACDGCHPSAWGRAVDPTSLDFTFAYRLANPAFDVWGWSFLADAGRAEEFLDIRNASGHGLTITGSGQEQVTTAAYFHPRQSMQVSGAGGLSRVVRAGRDGRLTFTADLGDHHTLQQYTPQERAAELSPGYWTTRTVTFTALPA